MADVLNFFEPYDSLAPHHENQLTRALLVVLRYCPMAHQAWLSLVEPGKQLHELPRPSFGTQRARILAEGVAKPIDEPLSGISVICAADAPEVSTGTIESDRGQILDGIIRYDNELVIVLESKLDGPASDRQAREINLHGQPVRFDGKVRSISWRAVLAAFDDLADEERGATAGAERIVLRDFLEFVDRNFPRLGPFSTLDRCKREPSRVARRLRAVALEAIGGEPIGVGAILPGRHQAVISAHLRGECGESPEVHLGLYPADTLEQARAFYARPKAVDRILALQSQGWSVSPNFHFGFMAKGLTWTTSTVKAADYTRYWEKHIGETRQIDRADWPAFWERLRHLGFAQPTDREQFDRDFTRTSRKSASPRPGIACIYRWPFEKAEQLDATGKFVAEVRKRVNDVLVAVEEPTLK